MPLDNNADHSSFTMRAWLAENGAAAAAAASLLGGKPAEQSVLRLIDELRRTGRVTRLMLAKLASLHRLLMLEDDGEGGLHPAMYLHPDDPRVLEICLLADSLTALLDGYPSVPRLVA